MGKKAKTQGLPQLYLGKFFSKILFFLVNISTVVSAYNLKCVKKSKEMLNARGRRREIIDDRGKSWKCNIFF